MLSMDTASASGKPDVRYAEYACAVWWSTSGTSRPKRARSAHRLNPSKARAGTPPSRSVAWNASHAWCGRPNRSCSPSMASPPSSRGRKWYRLPATTASTSSTRTPARRSTDATASDGNPPWNLVRVSRSSATAARISVPRSTAAFALLSSWMASTTGSFIGEG